MRRAAVAAAEAFSLRRESASGVTLSRMAATVVTNLLPERRVRRPGRRWWWRLHCCNGWADYLGCRRCQRNHHLRSRDRIHSEWQHAGRRAGLAGVAPALASQPICTSSITDLAATKSNGVASVIAGSTTNYTIRITNNGPTPVTGAIITDAAVAGLNKTGVVCSGSPGQCTAGTTPTLRSCRQAMPCRTWPLASFTRSSSRPWSLRHPAVLPIRFPLLHLPARLIRIPVNNSATDTDTVLVPAADDHEDGECKSVDGRRGSELHPERAEHRHRGDRPRHRRSATRSRPG